MAVRTYDRPSPLSILYDAGEQVLLQEVLQAAFDQRAKYTGEALSVGALATAAGLPPGRVASFISGRRLPSHDELNLLAMAMGLKPDDRKFLQEIRQKQLSAQKDKVSEDAGEKTFRALSGKEQRRVRSTPELPPLPKAGQPDPLLISTVKDLIHSLNEVRTWGGSPSLRVLEQRDERLRRSTLNEMLRREAIPKYEQFVGFLQACGIDRPHLDDWVFVWRRLKALERSGPAR